MTIGGGSYAGLIVTFNARGTYKFEFSAWNAGVLGPVFMMTFNINLGACVSYDEVTNVGTIVVIEEEVAPHENKLD